MDYKIPDGYTTVEGKGGWSCDLCAFRGSTNVLCPRTEDNELLCLLLSFGKCKGVIFRKRATQKIKEALFDNLFKEVD